MEIYDSFCNVKTKTESVFVARTRRVGFVETVKNLVVGKHTDTQVVIDKALVEGVLDGIEGYFCLFGKNILQSLILLLAISTDVDLVALVAIV